MKLSLGFSPCPNDTFIFDALVNGKIDTQGLEFEVILEDVQTLNEYAISGKLDISKISYGVLPKVYQQYAVLNGGGALGKGVGPLLIGKEPLTNQNLQDIVATHNIAIPGVDTTAHFLFSYAFPQAIQKTFLRFNSIEDWVLKGNGLGVIIHENRFTYQSHGLYKLIDLGAYWEETTQMPIPLGGIIINRKLDNKLMLQVDALIQASLQYAFDNAEIPDYVQAHAQEMEAYIMQQHIDLYVNNYSLNLGELGKAAVLGLLKTLTEQDFLPEAIFVH